jgi:Tfp pilus assembly protein PilF
MAPAWAYLGTALQFTGKTAEAVVAYKKAVELDPGNVPFRSTYGLLACVAGEHATGIAELGKVASAPGYKDTAGFTNLGWCYRNASPKRTKEAVDAYRRALELDPKNEQAALGMGWAYSYQQSYDEAIAAFQKAAQIDPRVTSEAMNGAAWCYFFKGDMAKAAEFLDKAQAAGRSDARLRENIAKVEKLKEQKEAYAKEMSGCRRSARRALTSARCAGKWRPATPAPRSARSARSATLARRCAVPDPSARRRAGRARCLRPRSSAAWARAPNRPCPISWKSRAASAARPS